MPTIDPHTSVFNASYAVEVLSLSGHHVLNLCIVGESLYLGAMCFV